MLIKRLAIDYIKVCLILFFILLIFLNSASNSAFGMTIKEEEKLGRVFINKITNQVRLINDPSLLDYINKFGRELTEVLPNKFFDFKFYIVYDKTYNAFAAPGGHVFINSGLIEVMDSVNELAGILCHELAHVVCRHISEKISKSKKTNIATIAGILAGALIGGNPGSGLIFGSMAAQQSYALAYSRENEREADQNGIKYMTEAGYSVKGLSKILKKIKLKNWIEVTEIPTYVLTHPALEERLSYVDSLMGAGFNCNIKIDKQKLKDFKKFHTRLVGYYGDTGSINKYIADIKKNPKDEFAYLGHALILSRMGNKGEAINQLQKALQLNAFDPDLLRDLGEIYFTCGRYEDAYKTLTGALAINPDYCETRYLFAQTLSKLGKYKKAIDIFEDLKIKYPDQIEIFYLLGETYGKLDQMGDAHFYLGIFYHKTGNFKNAKFHLKKAIDYLEKSSLKRGKAEKLLKNVKK